MARISINGTELHVEEHGTGPETIVFAHGLLWSGRMFDKQIAALRDRYRCVTFDFRGQGQSEVTPSGYDMDTLTDDAVAIIEKLGSAPCHFLGLSMGGFVGMRLAIRHPSLLRSLMLLETSADPEPESSKGRYRTLGFIARWLGLRLVAGRVMPIMFGAKFIGDASRAEERAFWRSQMVSNHRIGITRALGGVIDRAGVSDELQQIDLPTLIVVGDQDVATPRVRADRMHAQIRGSKLMVIPGAGHTSTIEEPASVNKAIAEFLEGLR